MIDIEDLVRKQISLHRACDLSLKAARVAVTDSDRARARLIRRCYGQTATDPLNHDVTVNTAELTIEAATEIVLTALQRKLALPLRERS